ncbi:MAG: 2-oxoglutarate and iron-dependent oxygenase domain-containing protein [Ilumatobacteraceae bacterium]
MSWVPVIDLGGSTAEVAAAMGEACRRVGFLTVTGHGVPQSVVDAAWDAGRAFFDLPLAHKMTVAMPSPGSPYGYSPIRGETLARSLGQDTPPDLKESLAIGHARPGARAGNGRGGVGVQPDAVARRRAARAAPGVGGVLHRDG